MKTQDRERLFASLRCFAALQKRFQMHRRLNEKYRQKRRMKRPSANGCEPRDLLLVPPADWPYDAHRYP